MVADVAASVRWYETALGMQPFAGDADKGYVALHHPGSGVAIVLSGRPDAPTGPGPLDHLAFAASDGAALQSWAEHLRESGIQHPGIVLELGKPSLQLRDPDGNAIELVAPRP